MSFYRIVASDIRRKTDHKSSRCSVPGLKTNAIWSTYTVANFLKPVIRIMLMIRCNVLRDFFCPNAVLTNLCRLQWEVNVASLRVRWMTSVCQNSELALSVENILAFPSEMVLDTIDCANIFDGHDITLSIIDTKLVESVLRRGTHYLWSHFFCAGPMTIIGRILSIYIFSNSRAIDPPRLGTELTGLAFGGKDFGEYLLIPIGPAHPSYIRSDCCSLLRISSPFHHILELQGKPKVHETFSWAQKNMKKVSKIVKYSRAVIHLWMIFHWYIMVQGSLGTTKKTCTNLSGFLAFSVQQRAKCVSW